MSSLSQLTGARNFLFRDAVRGEQLVKLGSERLPAELIKTGQRNIPFDGWILAVPIATELPERGDTHWRHIYFIS
jgi:hypothetical protein